MWLQGGCDRCPAASGPYLCAVTSAVAFISITLEVWGKRGKMPQKDKALLLSGSQGAVLYLSAAQGEQPKIPLNISVTNASVRRAAFGQLSPKRHAVTWRCFIWSDASDCAISPRRSWQSRSHFSFTLTNSQTSPPLALAPTSHLPIREPLFPSFLPRFLFTALRRASAFYLRTFWRE